MSAKIYYESDCDPSALAGKTIAVIGYGSQGHAHALNNHDSGNTVVVGARPDSRAWNAATADGLRVRRWPTPPPRPTWSCCSCPTTSRPTLYRDQIEPNLQARRDADVRPRLQHSLRPASRRRLTSMSP